MFVDVANAWLDLVIAVGAVGALVYGIYRWANRSLERRIIQEIKDATYQIQPKTNGGFSLSDLHNKIDSLSVDITILKNAVLELEDDVDKLEQDVEGLL
jgi:hypothetical protein